MNKAFKLVFNRVRGTMMVANELTKSHQLGKKSAVAVAVFSALVASGFAEAADVYKEGHGKDIVVTEADVTSEDKHRVIGGWKGWSDDAATATLNNTVTVQSGKWNLVVGGHYSGGKDKSITQAVENTNVIINGGTLWSVVGGTGASNNKNVTRINEKASANLTINGGTFGTTEEAGNATELFVLGGDLMKHGGDFENIKDAYAESHIGTTNIQINDGTFNSAIVGGSAAIVYYGDADKGAKTTVNKTNVTIEGGTFNHGIVAGGLASGHKTHAIVHEANLTIVKKDKPLVINNNVFAGGLLRTDGLGTPSDSSVTVDHATVKIEGVDIKGGIYGTHAALTGDVKPSDHNKITKWHYDPLMKDGKLQYVRTDLTMANASASTVVLGKDSTFTVKGGVDLEQASASDVAISLFSFGDYGSNQKGTKLNINTFTGTNNSIHFGSADASINIGKTTAQSGSTFTDVSASGNVNDDLGGDLEALADMVTIGDKSGVDALGGADLKLEQGDVFGATTGTIGADGKLENIKTSVNKKNVKIAQFALKMPTQIARIEANDLRKRMGDIRSSEGTTGAWARYDGGKFSGSEGFENTFNKIQIGADTVLAADAPRLGLAFSYTKGDADMVQMSADTDAYSLAAYGIWFGEAGQFADVIARVGTVNTDLSTNSYDAKYDQMMYALSGEFGWRFDITNQFFAEPAFELTYTRVNGDSYTAKNNHFTLDDYDSLVGSLGLAAGMNCSQGKGSLYARLGVAHEFLGDGKFTGTSVSGASRAVEVDGKDTWIEYAVGANYNVTKQTYLWGDVERTAGADVDEDWRASVGVRYVY